MRRDAAALLKVASNSSPASVVRRLRNDACESVIGSPALFHSSGGRSSGAILRRRGRSSEALCPPKPIELESAVLIGCARASLGT